MSYLFYWEEILAQINLIQKKLQEPGISFDVCVTHMDATKMFFNQNRDRLVSESVNQVKQSAREWKFQLKSGLEKRESCLGKKKMMYVKPCAGSKEKSSRMS